MAEIKDESQVKETVKEPVKEVMRGGSSEVKTPVVIKKYLIRNSKLDSGTYFIGDICHTLQGLGYKIVTDKPSLVSIGLTVAPYRGDEK